MKKIGIDARLYYQTGVGTYLQNLLFYLDKNKFKNEVYYIYLRKQDAKKIRFKSKYIIKRIADQKWHSFSEQIGFLTLLLKDNLDLMHFTYFSYPIFYWRKFMVTIHDTTPLLFKTGKASTKNPFIYQIKHFLFKVVLRLQVNRAVEIITPTNTVKNELIKIYGSRISKKIHPIYEGVSYKLFQSKENNNLGNKFRNFFIYVGNFYPHKNVENLLKAFSKLKTKSSLILIGPDDYFSRKIKLNKKILLFKNPPLSNLIFFYKNAKAIIHPSLSEGFGLPLIEAASFGTPIIASNIEVFKELWDGQYLSFNPNDVNDIVKKISIFIEKKTKFSYESILKKFSFEKMTSSTLKIYHKVTQNS
ncbi:MAG: Mannosyltransferase B [Candidatus Roizmanbacteria bacterium GW2011_GWC2_37_13]|uniref:Mannosyltransferase B n=1 Tax=Candidatus Roizmanbacteria bacterium GW2011_GWC2_37_13 TaxID=1618486 RepID=A0A0G0JEM6_9BACT|nr:MAG: glycosyl transferase, group 1 [Candidatus Roizmanbacteria bacterium GW2011_GWC1_37_12]KKQ26611.1 MAG: Mannosyltransferase B [Candidatus Roizmanbacteria bacterium GW2011_GWC2_37_13]